MEVQSGFWVTLAERNPSRRSFQGSSMVLRTTHLPFSGTKVARFSTSFCWDPLCAVVKELEWAVLFQLLFSRARAMQLSDPGSPQNPQAISMAGQLEYHQLLPRTQQLLEPALQKGQAPRRGLGAWGPGEGRWGTWLQELQMLRIFAPVAQAWYKPDRWWSLCCIQSLSAMLATRLYHSLSGWFACFRHDFAFLGRWFAADLNR